MSEPRAWTLGLSWAAVNRRLAGLFLLFTAAGVAAETAFYIDAPPELRAFARFFSLLEEGNLPTWYASMLLLACAALLLAIGADRVRRAAPDGVRWIVLAVAFLYISVDELVMIHEWLNSSWRAVLGAGGILHFVWVLPFGAIVICLFLAYLGFLARLPAQVRLLCVTAGLLYVGGALGTELPVGAWYERHGGDNPGYALLNVWQESLELLGVTVFLSALLAYVPHLERHKTVS